MSLSNITIIWPYQEASLVGH